ncbi:DNA polymerase III subunit alpha [Streptococcus constellatus subsp. pharyngis]|uniref:DNA polymerase III subunit alpha n=1 Tax=Streptococcus constellatus subsp. pharyngis SK1060 = CCUG 46377 TaxID=1035184 RepID=U2YA42_STRCV|nr:DNA polymerase III subunit alpha [Streptococcus constellatus]AGU72543.1 DNA polymerase III, alpha subunit [Streptococcus constellatus subsp. pharyngis C232]AGU74299.1 DNA polymerase III, alpha subunit [Streptococcus constellatus subsp. pharyngis C818]AGU79667.1 DNA polymerase III, alpha subunit [Streptococcus constellatus subsp. pharyngis C1050]QRP81981.1 DNA polymerase III subunit alpha [Streptococcus constellatus]GAD43597.1 DNA polymerase III, alpha subunit [Streptococcus constellatus sub
MVAQLDTKTVYTFMDSLISIKKYVKTAKALGYQTLGMMDIDNLYGAYHFMELATAQKIQPILGIEMTLDYAGVPLNLRFLALDSQGYRNLMKLSTLKMIGKSKWEELQHLLEGIAIIVPVFDGIRDLDLGKDFYIGVFPDTPQQDFMHKTLPLHTVRYFDTGDLETLQMLRAIRENSSLREVGHLPSNEYLLSSKQFTQTFQKNFPESLDNLEQLVAGVHYEINTELKLPRFNPERPAVEELRERADAGLKAKKLWTEAYQERLNQELAIIHQMGFDDYFLIVWDLLRFGRSQGYYMGMGRGSAVGSLVAYALEITGIDPVEKNLIFERFLNLERYTMPDIDIDIPDVYRPEFIRYVRDRYGTMHTAQIVTYSTFGAKQAIRDVFKRYGVPEYELTNITRKISFRDTLTSAYEKNMSFRQIINSKLEYQKAFEIAKKIEGNPRQTSIHAAGVVMSDNDLTEHIPLKYGEDMYITQYDAHGVESNGLLKMDFLGLRNLTFVQRMKEAALDKYGVAIDIAKIDLEDTITLQLFAAGRTKGIFQFEQAGAINLLKRVQPVQFEEIVATTSLNRPGASDYIDNFVKRKHGQEKVEMLDSSLEDILAPTYGIMLYQEQVMQVAQRFAGFSLGKADILRRAMGKKDATEMHRIEAEFVTGALDLGHSEIKAKEVFAVMEKFAGYGFNRSHAYAYSALAFQLAYFKAHYPDIFFDIMLNYSSSDYITDALEFDFQVASLNINNIPYRDKFQDKQIYLGLKNIKGLPRDVAYWIIENRPFSNVEDFVLKLPTQYHKVQLLTPLVQIGLFDVFEKNRQKILQNLPNLFVFADELGSLFADTNYSWTEAENYTEAEKFELEKEIIGVGLSEHPLVKLAKAATQSFTLIQELVENTHATILVEILSIRVIRTKTGENMAFLQVSDTKIKTEVTVFPDTFKQFGKGLHEKGFYYLTGRIQKRENRLQMILNHLQEANTERFWIQVENHESDAEISAILQQFRGDIPVVIRYENERKTVAIPQYRVQKSDKLQEELKKITMKTIYQ